MKSIDEIFNHLEEELKDSSNEPKDIQGTDIIKEILEYILDGKELEAIGRLKESSLGFDDLILSLQENNMDRDIVKMFRLSVYAGYLTVNK